MSGWIAFDCVGKSVEKTSDLLFKSFNLKFWLKLALVVFLINGSVGNGLNLRFYEFDSGNFDLMQYLPILIVITLLLVLIVVFFTFIGNVAVFVFLDSVLKRSVKLVDGLYENLGRGLKLFLFMICLSIIFIVFTGILFIPLILILQLLSGGLKFALILVYGFIASIILFTALIFLSVVGLFTVDFVVPLMYSKGEGILDSWKSLFAVIKKNQGQFVMYVIARILLGIATGILSAISGFILVFIPFFIIGIIVAVISESGNLLFSNPAILVSSGMIIFLIAMVLGYLMSIILLPIYVFYRYFSLIFIGKIIPELEFFKGKKEADEPKVKKELYVEVE
ncbi:MAG: hypothetical protein ABH851_06210 [Methanobacteriota archaeon]